MELVGDGLVLCNEDIKDNFKWKISNSPNFTITETDIQETRHSMEEMIRSLVELSDPVGRLKKDIANVDDRIKSMKKKVIAHQKTVANDGSDDKSATTKVSKLKDEDVTKEVPYTKKLEEVKCKNDNEKKTDAEVTQIKHVTKYVSDDKAKRGTKVLSKLKKVLPTKTLPVIDKRSKKAAFVGTSLSNSNDGESPVMRKNSNDVVTPNNTVSVINSMSMGKSDDYDQFLQKKHGSEGIGQSLYANVSGVAIPIDDELVCSSVDRLKQHLKPSQLNSIIVNGKYLRGTASPVKKGYRIDFDYSSKLLPSVTVSQEQFLTYFKTNTVLEYQDTVRLPANDIKDPMIDDPTLNQHRSDWMYEVQSGEETDNIEEASFIEDDDGGEYFPIGSDDEESVDRCEMDNEICCSTSTVDHSDEKLNGLVWKSNKVLNEPSDIPSPAAAKLKPNFASKFDTPLGSFLAFCPIPWFEKIMVESNKYALKKFSDGKPFGNFRICGALMYEITLREVMVFHGLLLVTMLFPVPGRKYDFYWSRPVLYPFVHRMKITRFKQIRSVISFNSVDPTGKGKQSDSLYKVRPILNLLKKTLPFYLIQGTEVALDEATFASRSSFARFMIYFNAKKPSGKFHFKLFAVCDSITNAMLYMRFCTRDNFEKCHPDETLTSVSNNDLPADDEEDESDRDVSELSKIDNIILDMCSRLARGTTINCDNWYTSCHAAVELKRRSGLFLRGTVRSNRRLIPSKLLFTNEEKKKPRGFRKVAVNEEYGITAITWLDKREVMLLTTADGTNEAMVQRREGSTKVSVPAPQCIARYNSFMGGVDRHDYLRARFSLHSRHDFRRYYVGLYLCLVDIALTNAIIHYKMRHPDHKQRNELRAEFIEDIVNHLLDQDTDWRGKGKEDIIHQIEFDEEDRLFYDKAILGHYSPTLKKAQVPVQYCSWANLSENRRHGGNSCQVCRLELRRDTVRKVGICTTHCIRLCTLPLEKNGENDYPELDWMCPDRDLSCSEKFHEFYLPRKAFKANTGGKYEFVVMSRMGEIYKKRKEYIDAINQASDDAIDKKRKNSGDIDTMKQTSDYATNKKKKSDDSVSKDKGLTDMNAVSPTETNRHRREASNNGGLESSSENSPSRVLRWLGIR